MKESERLVRENENRVPVVLEKYEGDEESNNPISILEENKYGIKGGNVIDCW